MCCTPQSFAVLELSQGKQAKRMRLITLAVCLCFIVISMLSTTFILTHASHTHDTEGTDGCCSVCVQIQNAQNLLKQLSMAIGGVAIALAGLFTAMELLKSISSSIGISTLVSLKVRLNN